MNLLFNSNGKWWLWLLCVWLGASLSRGATFTVTTTADSGAGSLRQAILDADTNSGPNNIGFQISGTPPFTITPLLALPAVGNPTIIDGTTQNGFTSAPVIELSGASAGANVIGLQLLSGFSTVRGLAINRFSAQGIVLNGPSNVIQGNCIGTDVTGTLARGNASYGLGVNSSGNLVGGTNAGNGNVISGGNDTGIYIFNTSANTIQGNLIGVTAAGTNALGNVNNGVVLDKSSGNWIGGTNSGARNVVSGNGQSGIYLNGGAATGNAIQGNYLGTDISGSLAVSNAADGITLNGAPGNTMGGATAGGGNVISGNGFAGVSINGGGASNNLVWGNLIGTDMAGKTALGNKNAGVAVSAAAGNQLGGTNAAAGNVISGNTQDGIFLTDGATGNLIEGNLIGLSAAGTYAISNGFNGISLSGAGSNLIGGGAADARNVISGNAKNGVGILGLSDSGNVVLGNYIGLDVTGHKAVANTLAGVRIQGCSNMVGGVTTGSGNVISGNGQQGVWLVGTNGNVTGNMIQGNLIGLDVTGAGSLGNNYAGIGISSAAGNQIGGTVSGARNVISANGALLQTVGYVGVFLIGAGTSGNLIQGNYIGTDSTGTLGRGNANEGIYVQDVSANQIGGSVTGAGNLIAANNARGIWLNNASGNIVQGNFIGTKADGTSALGNVWHGIDIDVGSTNNTVGGSAAGAGNRIAFAQSVYAGVRVRNGSMNNLISGNAIFSNGALGIDLGNNGVNTIYDCESGVPAAAANAGQNFPVLANAYSGSGTRIRGTLDSSPDKTYLLQFFASPAGESSGYGEGQVFLGQTNFTLGAMCSSNFTVFLPVSVPANWVVTATATSPANNTSEFSAWVPVVPVPLLQLAFSRTNQSQISLSWTNNGGSFGLEQTDNLSPPLQWTTVGSTPALTNGFYLVAIPTTNATTFYRLTAQ
jgi:titin